jgi:hypothetical protein
MPLVATSRPATPVKHGIACWMAVKGARPAEFVWVVATRDALHQFDPTTLEDQQSTVFTKHRPLIEAVASEKFDSDGPNPDNGEYEGRPILIVRSSDLPGDGTK